MYRDNQRFLLLSDKGTLKPQNIVRQGNFEAAKAARRVQRLL
jgi:hypothetical protein